MSGNSRRRNGGSSAGLVLTAAVAAIAGAAAVDHVHAQAEGRPSAVESAWRWFTEEVLGEPQAHENGRSGGSSRRGTRYGRLSAADVAALPTREYAGEGNENSDGERHKSFCAICQEAFREGERLLRLPCFHEMHTECIRDYLCSSERALCPICRHPVAETDLSRRNN